MGAAGSRPSRESFPSSPAFGVLEGFGKAVAFRRGHSDGLAFGLPSVDDHLANHGFLHAHQGLWTLAPAFDLNPFPERVRELKTWVSEESEPEATIEALMSVSTQKLSL